MLLGLALVHLSQRNPNYQGCVDAPPGKAAKDILNALSYAPTHESYSSSSQEEFRSCSSLSSRSSGASWGTSNTGGSLSPKMPCNVLPRIPQAWFLPQPPF